MTTIKINAITVAEDGDAMVHRFASRAGAVDGFDGFEGFELLAPTDGRNVYLVVTRWRDEASYEAWIGSDDFRNAHKAFRPASDGGTGGVDASAAPPSARPPISAELWSYKVATGGDATR